MRMCTSFLSVFYFSCCREFQAPVVQSCSPDDEIQIFVVALDLVSTLEPKWGVKLVVNKTVLGSDLENCR